MSIDMIECRGFAAENCRLEDRQPDKCRRFAADKCRASPRTP
jgi:hypothetical protein